MRSLGLAYLSQKFDMGDGATVAVRIEPGHEYIRIEGGNYVAVFPTVQMPDVVSSHVGRISIGHFNAVDLPPDSFNLPQDDLTWFGKSAFSASSIHRTATAFKFCPLNEIIIPSTGTLLNLEQHNDFIVDGKVLESSTLTPVYKGYSVTYIPGVWASYNNSTNDGYDAWFSWTSVYSQMAHCINSGKRPVLATIEINAEYQEYSHDDPWRADPYNDAFLSNYQSQGKRVVGTSVIRLRELKTINNANGTTEVQLKSIDVGALQYSSDYGLDALLGENEFHYDIYTDFVTIRNDVLPSWTHRLWHAGERINVSPNGSVFVLRETNYVDNRNSQKQGQMDGAPIGTPQYSNSVTRGYSLSYVTPARVVMDNIISGDLGRFGYIAGVIPSVDGKKVYIYYGLHDSSETVPEITIDSFNSTCPLKYLEYLDEITITGASTGFNLSKTRTIELGSVTHRTTDRWESGTLIHEPDHYESKLYGAAFAVSDYIWSDRFCYNVKTNTFLSLPDYVDPVPATTTWYLPFTRDQATGPREDRTSYIQVKNAGKTADYYRLWFGNRQTYTLSKDPDTKQERITTEGAITIPCGGYSRDETMAATSAKF